MSDKIPRFLDVLEVRLAFSQRPLLEAREFEKEARRRGVHLFGDHDLPWLHRTGVLVPMLEARRDVRWALREAKRSARPDWSHLSIAPPKYGPELQRAVKEGRVFPARAWPFRSPR